MKYKVRDGWIHTKKVMDLELETCSVTIESRTKKGKDKYMSLPTTSETVLSDGSDVNCSDNPLLSEDEENPPTNIVKSHSETTDLSKSVSLNEKISHSMAEKIRRSSSTNLRTDSVTISTSRADLSRDSVSMLNREKFDTPTLETRPESYMWLAICTTMFFNPVLGIIALVTSMQADREYLRDNMENSKKLGKAVKVISIVGISSTVKIVHKGPGNITGSLHEVITMFLSLDLMAFARISLRTTCKHLSTEWNKEMVVVHVIYLARLLTMWTLSVQRPGQENTFMHLFKKKRRRRYNVEDHRATGPLPS